MDRILVTGAAGFIGYHVAETLLEQGDRVVGIDNLNEYYDPGLKESRLARLRANTGFAFERVDVADRQAMKALFCEHRFGRVIHLAAQAGVRYSVTNPEAYIDSNLVGFGNILEACRQHDVQHLVYASSSSVYGANSKMPFHEDDLVGHPLSLYAATKRANELMAHTYSHLYRLPTTGLRFFTVYGPWGRPDMAIFKFTKAILAGEPIDVYNGGEMKRDFTYIEDIVQGIVGALSSVPKPDSSWSSMTPNPSTSQAPFQVYNIGNSEPVELMKFIRAIEIACGKEAQINFMPMQPGDVAATHADTRALKAKTGYQPRTFLEEGVASFVEWYRGYYRQ